MKDRLRKALVLLMGVVGMLAANAAVSFTELTDQFVLSATEAEKSTQYRASTSLTIKLSGTATDGVFTLLPSFYVPEGVTLTVDASGVTGGLTTIRMKGGLRGTGTIAFGAGVTKLVFGEAPTWSNILGDQNKMPVLESDVTFAEVSASMEITGGVSLVRWPTSSYTIAADTLVATMGPNLFTGDTLTLDQGWDLMLNTEDAIKTGCKIIVPTGRTLYHRPTRLYAVDAKSASHVQTWAGITGATHELDIELQGGSFVTQSRTHGNRLLGDFTGTGIVDFAQYGSLTFEGVISFTADISLTFSSDTVYTFKTSAGSTMENVNIEIPGGEARPLTFEPAADTTLKVKSIAGTDEKTPILAVNGGAVEVGALSGRFDVTGTGGKLSVGANTAVLKLHPGVTLALAEYDIAKPVTLVADEETGNTWLYEGPATGRQPVAFSGENLGEDSAIELGGKVELVKAPAVSVFRIGEGADVRAFIPHGAKIVNAGGLLEQVPSWQAKVALWLDASQASTLVYAKPHIEKMRELGRMTGDVPPADSLYEWTDCRPWQRDVSLRAAYYDNFLSSVSYSPAVFPLVAQDGNSSYVRWKSATVGKPRLLMGGRDHESVSLNAVTVSARCVISVFSAQDGGGTAMLMEKDAALKRTTDTSSNTSKKDWPICLNEAILARTNGVAVTTGTTGTAFTGGWQLVTLSSAEDLSIYGIGHAMTKNTGTGNGGQSYREILIFSEEPTVDERNAAEKYLAAKWGLPIADAPAADEEPLSVSGSGTVKVAADAAFDTTGYFNGTLDLNGKRVSFGSVKLPFKAAEIPAKDRLIWVDARAEGAVVFGDDAEKPDEIKMIYARDNNGLKETDGDYYVTSPWLAGEENTNNNRRVRFVDGWLDFRNGYTHNDTRGNLMFMQKLPFKQMPQYDSDAEEIDIAAGFFALDSSRNGGGSLMTSAANGRSRLLRSRGTGANAAIWSLEEGSTVTIDTRLNGASVEMTDPFSGGKDVMSFNINNGDVARVKCFGFANPGSSSHNNSEIFGEWLLYSANVPAADRERIEAYLTFKWKNELMAGFGETRDMSVSGTGTIAVANPESLPTLAQDFTGIVELTENTYAFTLPKEGTEAVEAVKLPGQTVRMQGEVTIDLDATAAKSGSYLLLSAADLAAGTTFTLGTVADRKTREIVLSVRDNALYADVKPNGILLIVR